MAEAIRDPAELGELLDFTDDQIAELERASKDFPLLVPRPFLARMRPGDPLDPLLLQVLPQAAELLPVDGFRTDPLEEQACHVAPGLLRKYAGRALLITTGSCPVHCRYCFRRHYAYSDEPGRFEEWLPALEAIAADPSIHEVLLSGGDPLMLQNSRLAELCDALDAVPHVRRVRVHTRMPVVVPERVTPGLIELLSSRRMAPIVVVHLNHPSEIAEDSRKALRGMVRAGIPVLSQSVLLRGINDSSATLAELFEQLIDLGVMPYYLHQLDPVRGAGALRDEGRAGTEADRGASRAAAGLRGAPVRPRGPGRAIQGAARVTAPNTPQHA